MGEGPRQTSPINGRRLVAQLPASTLFLGMFDTGSPAGFRGNPGTIGIQTGFTADTLASLGELAEVAEPNCWEMIGVPSALMPL